MATPTIDIEALPDVYAMTCIGHCMEPGLKNGSVLVFDKLAAVRPGDLAVIWRRPDCVRPGESQATVRRVVMGPPPPGVEPARGVYTEAADILVQQSNPSCSTKISLAQVAAVHRCVGPTERYGRRPPLPRVAAHAEGARS